jgi:hypothetical protein
MTKKYSSFYSPVSFSGVTSLDNNYDVLTVSMFFGVRFDNRLLGNGSFYTTCGFYTAEDVVNLFFGNKIKPRLVLLRNQIETRRLGVLNKFSFNLVLKDPKATPDPLIGSIRSTTIGIAGRFRISKPKFVLIQKECQFSGAGSATYEIDPSSIKLVGGKGLANY